jgi:hypothetical protein
VNGQAGVIQLTLDNIPNTATRKAGDKEYNTAEQNKLDSAYVHSQQLSGNPHNVTKAQVGL